MGKAIVNNRMFLGSVLLVIFFCSLILLRLYFIDAAQGTLELEAAKSLLQVGAVAVSGAVISLLVFEYQSERLEDEKQHEFERQQFEKQRDLDRKQLEYQDERLLSTLSQAMNAYSQAVNGRRLLPGKAIKIQDEGKQEIVLVDHYETYLETIIDAQLELENLARDVETSAKASSHAGTVKDYLWDMESYLNKLIGEYGVSRRCFSDSKLSLDELPRLEDFLLSAEGLTTVRDSPSRSTEIDTRRSPTPESSGTQRNTRQSQ